MSWHDAVRTSMRLPAVIGLAALVIGAGGFGVWAAVAPLEGAVIAPAKVIVTGNNKVLQHLEGGIIRAVLVREGEAVAVGQPLLELDATTAEAQVNRLRLQLRTLEAMAARALAERDGADEITFPEALTDDPESATLVADQRAEFQLRLSKHRSELAVLEKQIAALKERITGHEIEKEQIGKQVALVIEERKTMQELLADGLARRSQVVTSERSEADLRAREGRLIADIAEAKQSIAQIEERIAQAGSTRAGEASSLLSDLRFRISESAEQLRAAESISTRTIIRAPVAGVVIDLAQAAAGSVLAPGQPMMSIVPEGKQLVVEAHIRPQDIDEVQLGQEAWLRLPAFDMKEMPPVAAHVAYLSADRVDDERTGEAYYVARLEIAGEQPEGFEPSVVRPGLDAEVFIATGEKTFFEYLAAPIVRSFDRSFRES